MKALVSHRAGLCTVVLTLFLSVWPLQAQMRTLIPRSVSHGVYIGPLLSSSPLGPNREFGLLPGLQAGWILNKKLTLGWKANQLWKIIPANWVVDEDTYYLNLSYTGLFASYTPHPDALFHTEYFALLGAGLVGYRLQKFGDFDNLKDDLFLVEPGVVAEANITHFMRVGLGVSYLIVQGIELENTSNADFSGINLLFVVKVGKF